MDGLSGVKQAVFLESYAGGLTVEEAAAAAGVSVSALYNFANRAAGQAFAIAWDAAAHRRRRRFADQLMDRALKGQTEVLRGENGRLVGTRHRHDNRLAMAMWSRSRDRIPSAPNARITIQSLSARKRRPSAIP